MLTVRNVALVLVHTSFEAIKGEVGNQDSRERLKGELSRGECGI